MPHCDFCDKLQHVYKARSIDLEQIALHYRLAQFIQEKLPYLDNSIVKVEI